MTKITAKDRQAAEAFGRYIGIIRERVAAQYVSDNVRISVWVPQSMVVETAKRCLDRNLTAGRIERLVRAGFVCRKTVDGCGYYVAEINNHPDGGSSGFQKVG